VVREVSPTPTSADGASIRTARAEDLEDLVRLLGVLFTIESDFRPDPERQRRGLARMLEEPERRLVLVAEAGGLAVGMVTAQLLVSTAEGGEAALIEDMVVAASARRQGLGRRLLGAAAEWSRRKGATRLQLLVDRTNHPALLFYDRMGWRPTELVALHQGGVGLAELHRSP
jgi:GNAT superfamily N-acetyltransferase